MQLARHKSLAPLYVSSLWLTVMLRDRLPGLVDQVFVITHASEIEKAATGSLYVLQREKNEDGITIPLNKLIDAGSKII